MPRFDDPLYYGREQSLIKHVILEKYLQRFAIIVGKHWDEISYIDCFSGPWNSRSEDLSDASFAIALKQLETAQDVVHKSYNKTLSVRCLFLEKDKDAFAHLQQFAADVSNERGAIVKALNKNFEAAVPDILRFIQHGRMKTFPFIFIDPTGWTGFAMPVIAPLLQLRPNEVLVNFMTSFVLRFIEADNPQIEAGFEKLFGARDFRTNLSELRGSRREDAVVIAYAEKLAEVGNFPYFSITIVPHPEKDRTHFHLIYATRHPKGIEVFKEAENAVVTGLKELRANVKLRKKETATGQSDLFGADENSEASYIDGLKSRYATYSKEALLELLGSKGEVSYDIVYATVMRYPLVNIEDLRAWLSEYTTIHGLSNKERVPKLGHNHVVSLKH